MFSESNATQPVRCFCPLQKVIMFGALFFKSELAGPDADCNSWLAQFVDGAPPKSLLNLSLFFTFFTLSFCNEPRFIFAV
jgi:hypothetical protein